MAEEQAVNEEYTDNDLADVVIKSTEAERKIMKKLYRVCAKVTKFLQKLKKFLTK